MSSVNDASDVAPYKKSFFGMMPWLGRAASVKSAPEDLEESPQQKDVESDMVDIPLGARSRLRMAHNDKSHAQLCKTMLNE